MASFDFAPAAERLKSVAASIVDDDLDRPTPCTEYSVRNLLAHVVGLTVEFGNAATKSTRPAREGEPAGPGDLTNSDVDPQWRTLLPQRLDELVAAWRNPAAWEGDTAAGGLALPAEIAALVAMDELVLHGWDLARATGQEYVCDPVSAQAVFEFTTMSAAPDADREGLFGDIVPVPDDAPVFDRALGLSGRDPAWTPPA